MLLPLAASADHAEPTLPLTADIVQALSACNGSAGTSIPTEQAGDATTPPDRYNGSSSNESTAGSVAELVIHANAESDPKELTLDISGSHNVLDGLVNSRSHLKISGSWNQLRHGTDYGQRSEPGKVAFDLTGSDNCFSPIPTQTYENAPPDSPAGFPLFSDFDPDQDGNVLEHFAPGSAAALAAMADPTPGPQYFVCGIADPDGAGTDAAVAPGCSGSGADAIMDRNVQGQMLEKGLYFVTGRAKISASNVNATLTVVTGQQLNVNGSFQGQGTNVFSPYTEASGAIIGDLLFASQWDEAAPLSGPTFPDGSTDNDSPNTDKAEDALKIEGSQSRFEGIIVATNGRTELAGEQNDFRCPVMGDRVRLNGSKLYFNAAGCVAQADVQVVKTPDSEATFPGTINVGDVAVFNITVTNNGPVPADNVVLTDVLPSGLTWTVSGPDAAACTPPNPVAGGATLTCSFGTVGFPTLNTRSITLTSSTTTAADCARDNGSGEIDNNAFVTATGDTGTTGNNTDHGDVIVKCPDVQVVKTPDSEATFPGSINAGANAVFNITVTNNGPGAANNVVLTDVLPNSGLLWTLGGTDEAACVPDAGSDSNTETYQGGTTLTCNFGTVAAPPTGNTRTISLTAPTTAADCARDGGSGEIENNAFVTATGDTATTGNNTDHGDVIVKCSAIRINKDSTKGGPVLVAGATFTISPHPTGTGSFTVVDNGTNDSDPAIGEVCVSPVIPGVEYTITETVAPVGYGLPADVTETTTPAAGGTCASGAGTVTFVDPPLVDIQARFRSQVPGEASLTTPIACDNATGTADTTGTTGWDATRTVTGIRTVTSPATITVTCTFVIDP